MTDTFVTVRSDGTHGGMPDGWDFRPNGEFAKEVLRVTHFENGSPDQHFRSRRELDDFFRDL